MLVESVPKSGIYKADNGHRPGVMFHTYELSPVRLGGIGMCMAMHIDVLVGRGAQLLMQVMSSRPPRRICSC